jgi:hypothetical protein
MDGLGFRWLRLSDTLFSGRFYGAVCLMSIQSFVNGSPWNESAHRPRCGLRLNTYPIKRAAYIEPCAREATLRDNTD